MNSITKHAGILALAISGLLVSATAFAADDPGLAQGRGGPILTQPSPIGQPSSITPILPVQPDQTGPISGKFQPRLPGMLVCPVANRLQPAGSMPSHLFRALHPECGAGRVR